MCLAIPLKIVEINGKEAIGEVEGVTRKIRIDFIENAKVGDYCIVHAGFAIERLDEEQALENIGIIKEVTDALGTI
jgi:hydrogenase expression/formation protein HypC